MDQIAKDTYIAGREITNFMKRLGEIAEGLRKARMSDKAVRKRIKAIQIEIDKWREKIAKMDLYPCQNDKDLMEKEKRINEMWNIVFDLQYLKAKVMLNPTGPNKHHDEVPTFDKGLLSEGITIVSRSPENRDKPRYAFEKLGESKVEFRVVKGSKKYRVRKANVIDSSKHGFAIIVAPKSDWLLTVLKVGDKLQDISFFGAGAKVMKDGIVRHKTRIHRYVPSRRKS